MHADAALHFSGNAIKGMVVAVSPSKTAIYKAAAPVLKHESTGWVSRVVSVCF